MKNNNLLENIVDNAREIPLECQEKVLDILKAMRFAKKCAEKELKKEELSETDKTSKLA